MALPGFFKIFLSHFSSESMVIPASYYDELPLVLPKTALLQGSSTGGCFWKVAMLKRRDEVYFGQGWAKFVEDNRLRDGDVMTFVYDGSRSFTVSIYSGSRACTEVRAVAQVISVDDDDDDDDKEDTNTSSEPDMSQTVPFARHQAEDSNIIEPEVAQRVPRTRNRGKKRVVVVEDSDESFISEDSNSMSDDSSYSPPNDDTLLDVTPKVTNTRKNGELRSVNSNVGSTSNSSRSVSRKRPSAIKNPEVYLDDPQNVCFETIVKNRIYELAVPKQTMKDYCLKFQDYVCYIDNHKNGKLEARAATWQDQRVSIKKWERIVQRNSLKKGDRLLCELFRKDGFVYAIKIHIVNTTSSSS